MPEQKPISSIISRSYSVRILIRCASSNLPCFSNHAIRSPNSSRIASSAALHFLRRRDELFAGINRDALSSVSIFSPVSGSNRVMRSISSPKNSTRNASSRPAGHNSTVSPRTRNWPRVELDVIARVLQIHQPLQELIARDLLPDCESE